MSCPYGPLRLAAFVKRQCNSRAVSAFSRSCNAGRVPAGRRLPRNGQALRPVIHVSRTTFHVAALGRTRKKHTHVAWKGVERIQQLQALQFAPGFRPQLLGLGAAQQ
jgi:hypothetical protein